MFLNRPLQVALHGMCKTADVSLAVYRAGGGSARSQPGAMLGSGPPGELIVGQRAPALLRRGLLWQVSSPNKAL